MTQQHQKLDQQWMHHLDQLSGSRRTAVANALRRSSEEGWPPSEEAVQLLVAYAQGQITSRDYARGILREERGESATPEPDRVPTPAAPTPSAPPQIKREDAVQAYVSGLISVEEFLQITRG